MQSAGRISGRVHTLREQRPREDSTPAPTREAAADGPTAPPPQQEQQQEQQQQPPPAASPLPYPPDRRPAGRRWIGAAILGVLLGAQAASAHVLGAQLGAGWQAHAPAPGDAGRRGFPAPSAATGPLIAPSALPWNTVALDVEPWQLEARAGAAGACALARPRAASRASSAGRGARRGVLRSAVARRAHRKLLDTSSPSAEGQQLCLADLKAIAAQTEVSDLGAEVLARLKPQPAGTFTFQIEGRPLVLDPRPSGGAKFTDFFTALDRAIADLAREHGADIATDSALGVLIAAQRHGDLNLSASKLVRETATPGALGPPLGPDFTAQRKLYLLGGLDHLLRGAGAPGAISINKVAISPDAQCRRRQALPAPSLIPFKRGDLARMCASQVGQLAGLGFRRMAVFQSIHLAGGNYGTSDETGLPAARRAPADPVRGKDYRFERLNAPTPEELEQCVGAILDAGLELTYLPHLESIVTINSAEEAEWRIATAIRLDDEEFFQLAYAPVIRALNARANRLNGVQEISIAAELDKSSLYYPDAANRLITRIERELTIPRDRYELQWNPNGDFGHLDSLRPRHASRSIDGRAELRKMFGKIDTIGPSIYDVYGHVYPLPNEGGNGGESGAPAPSYAATRAAFMGRLRDYLEHQYAGLGTEVSQQFRDRFALGEFSLNGEREGYYRKVLEEALAVGGRGEVTLWTTGQDSYDPLVKPGTKTQVVEFLGCSDAHQPAPAPSPSGG